MKLVHGMNSVELDILLAGKYRGKVENAKSRKIEFALTFAEYKAIMTRKRCAYTGVELTMHRKGNPGGRDVTLERIDNNKGYVKDNCVAITYTANNVKSVFENDSTPLTVADAIRMFATIDKMQKKLKIKA